MSRLNKATRLSITATVIVSLSIPMGFLPQRAAVAQLEGEFDESSWSNPETDFSPDIELIETSDSESEVVRLPGFSPEEDGFQFSNAELSTALRAQVERTDKHLVSNSTAYSDLLTLLFGEDLTCHPNWGKARKCFTTVQARRWVSNQVLTAVRDGVCDGMAVASQMLWVIKDQKKNPFGSRSQHLNNLLDGTTSVSAFSLNKSSHELKDFLLETYTSQTADEIYKQEEVSRQKAPTEILSQIRSSIANYRSGDESWKDLVTIGIHQVGEEGKFIEGHTLVPFAVEQNGNLAKVSVYDANYPGTTQYLTVDTDSDTWKYQPETTETSLKAPSYEGNQTSKTLGVITMAQRTIPFFNEQGFESCPYCATPDSNMTVQMLGTEGTRTLIWRDEYIDKIIGYVPGGDHVKFLRGLRAMGVEKWKELYNSPSEFINQKMHGASIKASPGNHSKPAEYVIPGSLDAYALKPIHNKGKVRFQFKKTGLSAEIETSSSQTIYVFNPSADVLAVTDRREIKAIYKEPSSNVSYKIAMKRTSDGGSQFYTINKKSQRLYFGGVQGESDNVTFNITVTRLVDEKPIQTITFPELKSGSKEFNYVDVKALPWDTNQQVEEVDIDIQSGVYNAPVSSCKNLGDRDCMRAHWKALFRGDVGINYEPRESRGDKLPGLKTKTKKEN